MSIFHCFVQVYRQNVRRFSPHLQESLKTIRYMKNNTNNGRHACANNLHIGGIGNASNQFQTGMRSQLLFQIVTILIGILHSWTADSAALQHYSTVPSLCTSFNTSQEKFINKDLLHRDAKLDSVRRLLFSRPHQSQEPVGPEDPQLRITQLVERVSKRRGKLLPSCRLQHCLQLLTTGKTLKLHK